MRVLLLGFLVLSACGIAPANGYENKDALALSRYIMGLLYEKRGEVDKAIPEYQSVLREDPQNTRVHLSLASSYIKRNETSKAVEELTKVARLDPKAVEPHAVLSLLYSVMRKPELANKEYERALENAALHDPDNDEIGKALGMMYLAQKRLDDAERMYRQVVAHSPQDAEAYFYLAVIADQGNKSERVVAELTKAIELKPDYPEALNYLGYLFVERNTSLEKAEGLIKKALAFEPDNGAYVDSLGWLYFKKGLLTDALTHLEKANALLDDPVISDHLGDAYWKAGKAQKAKMYWEKSLRLDGQQASVKKKLDSVHEHE